MTACGSTPEPEAPDPAEVAHLLRALVDYVARGDLLAATAAERRLAGRLSTMADAFDALATGDTSTD